MLANWLISTDDFIRIFGFPLACLFVIYYRYEKMRKHEPERWERVKRGEDEETERRKKIAKGALTLGVTVIKKLLKK